MMNEKRFDTKIGFLYETASQFAREYSKSITEAYERTFPGSSTGTKLSPAELLDDLAMVMYEFENDESEI